MTSYDLNVGFIGGGNMAKAIGEVIIKKGLFKPSQVWVSGPHIENLHHWKTLGANITIKNGEVVSECNIIFICVKPHLLSNAITGVQNTLSPGKPAKDKLFVSILAGTNIKILKQALSSFRNARIVRIMPNTPMTLGVGATVYTPDETATEKDCEIIEKILACAGIYQQVPETMINAVGGLAGSGPAFVYLMIEALSDGGVKQGIPRAMATKFAAQTVMGAAQMVLETGKHPGQLKDEVCSPGGSTICGMYELEKGGVRASYISAVQSAVERSTAMGKLNES